MQKLYDKSGGVFSLDHEIDGKAFVRPFVKVITQSGYGDDVYEDEGVEPAAYLVEMDRAALFDAPPVAAVVAEIAAKQAELAALKAEGVKVARDLQAERSKAERELRASQAQLDTWMKTHSVMIDLGKLLDGKVLYPLSVEKNPYHHGRSIPRIPEMRNAAYLTVHAGDFNKGQAWRCKQYANDTYGYPFMFFDTEEERTAVIRLEFEAACHQFRQTPNFDTTKYTTSTTMHYGTLLEWVATHTSLSIPDDIEAMKAAHDADLIEKKKAALAAELAAMQAA